ncbi:hypothetical protein [Leifsonia sp. WHRI 6310E]|uniref:hypothetical protein n=1 Tax=Leifsonia sp. WHRI 6310E TaxID=3162562 RepID=UPI0032F03F51
MTARTPLYAIPVPDSTTKAYQLGDELYAMGIGVEQALIAAGVPAATNQDRVVAATAAARDAKFGTPTTEAARLALQARGAECVRTDKGWTERYYATFDATSNPGGAPTAGWYPIAGSMPAFVCSTPVAQAVTGGWSIIAAAFGSPPAPDLNRGFRSFSAGVLTIEQPGLYDVVGNMVTTVNGVQSVAITLNSAAITAGLLSQAQVSGITAATPPRTVRLKAGDQLRLWGAAPSASTVQPASFLSALYRSA